MDDGTLDDRKLSENMFEFDEGWGEKTLDDEKLCKNIFESKLIKVSYRLPMNKNRFRTKVFPPLFVSFNLKFKSMDDGILERWKIVQEYIQN